MHQQKLILFDLIKVANLQTTNWQRHQAEQRMQQIEDVKMQKQMKREIIQNGCRQNTLLAENTRFKWHNFNCCQVQTKKRDEKYHQFIFTCDRPVDCGFYGSTCMGTLCWHQQHASVIATSSTSSCHTNNCFSPTPAKLSRISQSVNKI